MSQPTVQVDWIALPRASATTADNYRPARPPLGGLAPWQAKRVASYVREHIEARVMVRELAELVRLSTSHFHRRFKASFGEPPAIYITRQRMSLARDLLTTTDSPVSQIALGCGLSDQAHFSRVFRRNVGTTPRLYRRQYATQSLAR
jgi:transcriptional regulator GlxA family with amidase domain